MKGYSRKRRRCKVNGELVAVARTDSMNLAYYYGELLREHGIESTIKTGGETAGLFSISIFVSGDFYDEAYLFIEAENNCEPYYLDSRFEPPRIRRQTG
jgi:hypothetical protein